MPAAELRIRRIDARRDDTRAAIDELRERLSPRGNVVSEAGRRKTLEVFGEALTPAQVVERICGEVRSRGLAALLDYSARLDKANVTAETLRVTAAELQQRMRRPIRSFWPPFAESVTTCWPFSGPSCTPTSGCRSRRVGICGNVTCHCRVSAFACRAVLRRILRPC